MQPVLFAQNVIDIYGPRINVNRRAGRADKPRSARRVNKVRPWYQVKQPRDHWISNRRSLGVARHKAVDVQSLTLTQPFVREEKKYLLLNDRTSQIATKLITLEWRWAIGSEFEEVTCIKHVVPKELKQFAVEFIGARACSKVDYGACTLT